MNQKENCLIEIKTEELPPKALLQLIENFKQKITEQLEKQQLTFSKIESFASPRRLALIIYDLIAEQAEQIIERKGPFVAQAYDNSGNPTPAALGFAKSLGVDLKAIETKSSEKGDYLFYIQKKAGAKTIDLLPMLLTQVLEKLPAERKMRWGNGEYEFIRPIHSIALIYGKTAIHTKVFGIQSDNITFGHPILQPGKIKIHAAEDYAEELLKKAFVKVDYATRKIDIEHQLKTVSQPLGHALIDPDLLEEVAALTEWPVALLGKFDEKFLTLPKEVLITVMKVHQRVFAVLNKDHEIQPYFITVSDIVSKNPERVIKGFERVIRARLEDALFFYQNDLKENLQFHLEPLKQTRYHEKLGSIYDKSLRMVAIAKYLANELQSNSETAERSALLAKADLTTQMVSEFPELQGIMGFCYAKTCGETEAVALAIREHYQPRFAEDMIPATEFGAIVALADKTDTIAGIFSVNEAPTGEKDPYALRRAALGVIRIFLEKKWLIDLRSLVKFALENYQKQNKTVSVDTQSMILDFILQRFRYYYLEQGYDIHTISAVLSVFQNENIPLSLIDIHQRITAIQKFLKHPNATALISAHKRVHQILKKNAEQITQLQYSPLPNSPAATEKLAASLADFTSSANSSENYEKRLEELANLKEPIDQFFENVLVISENLNERRNNLALLKKLNKRLCFVADLSLL